MITIAKASAGSGKTYTLARTYISLLLQAYDKDPYPYRHILAVTFTNKATAEMKARILKELDILAHSPSSSDYYKDFVPSVCRSAEILGSRCRSLLQSILHDYSSFSIYTIDRFFQQILRSFARELGQFESYQLELDKSQIVNESVDRLLEALSDDNAELVEWLKDSAMKQIASKGYFRINETLYSAAADLQNQHFLDWMAAHGISDLSSKFSRDNIRAFRESCDRLVREFHSSVRYVAGQLMSCFSVAGISLSDCQKGTFSVVRDYGQLSDRSEVKAPSEAFCRRILNPSKLLLKSCAGKTDALPADYSESAAALVSLFYVSDSEIAGPSKYYKAYRTALQIRDISYGLGICGELYDSFSSLTKDRNVLCLEDSNSLLSRIVDGSDVPFVYEKTGVRYEHFLLDEFQDTSLVQWNNFLPLLRESNANGNDNLIVGDVKQSIYRWRDSDWNLLNREVGTEFPDSGELVDGNGRPRLSVNYRTEENVVRFNNGFFRFISRKTAANFPQEQGRLIEGIYGDVCQDVSRKGGLGEVRICFTAEDARKAKSGEDLILKRTLELVEELHVGKKVRYGEIAIVIRNNAPGERIADALLAKGVPVISDDSLSVNNSIVVRKIVSVLSSVENPGNQASGYLAHSIGFTPSAGETSLLSLTEEIIRALKKFDAELVDAHTLYVQAFVDWMQNWTSINGNRLKDFLKAWKDSNVDFKSVKIASPASSDAVRVITIHKSKGLEFPYVIMPYVNDITFFRQTDLWAEPEVPAEVRGNTGLDKAVQIFDSSVRDMVFKPRISSGSVETYFAPAYHSECFSQAIDALNLIYVAMTRPERGLYIVAGKTSWKSDDTGIYSNAADALMSYLSSDLGSASLGLKSQRLERDGYVEYLFGEFCSAGDILDARPGKKDSGRYCRQVKEMELESRYPSYPMDSSRLRIDRDASEFFLKDGEDENRLRGIVLHNLLSSVVVPADLESAVQAAVEAGDLTRKEGASAKELLGRRLASAVRRGWFSESVKVLNERGIITPQGEELRPDRVEIRGTEVCIIDYKFGNHRQEYVAQVENYACTYRQMGYGSVRAYLWYVYGDDVVQVV
ncbi:MAG: UvrD-helicase domain-containing protein [Candidatus Cryptobacteroides sp.]